MKKIFFSLKCILLTATVLLCIVSCDNSTEISEIENTSAATGKISGKVKYSNFDETNNSGIIVTLEKTDGLKVLSNSSKQIVTSTDGSFLFENLSEGVYTISASGAYSRERAVCRNIVVRASETTITDTLNLVATGSISGKITTEDNENIGFLVFIAGTSYMSITDDEGLYTISEVPVGNGYQVLATKNGIIHNLSSDVSVTANNTTILTEHSFTISELKDQYKGEQGIQGEKGTDGISIIWLGAFDDASEIYNPQYLNAYFNKTDGCSYIYTEGAWKLLANNGLNGTDIYAALIIEAEVSTEEMTNQPVVINVFPNKSSILKIGYVYSIEEPNFKFSNAVFKSTSFVDIVKDSDGNYSMTADESGYYTIAAKDKYGFTSSTIKHITNIDMTPPDTVVALHSKYNRDTKVLSLTWTNPNDSDFDYVNLSYTKGGILQTENVQITDEVYVINDVEVDGDEYMFTVFTVDDIGNIGEVLTANIVPKIHAVGDVLLNDGTIVPYDEYELSFTDEQKQKAVGVLYGIDESSIPMGWIGIHNSASGTYSWAEYNTTGCNTFFSDITSNDKYGFDNWDYICLIDPSGTADAGTNYRAFNYANNYGTLIGLTGDYAKGWYIPSYSEWKDIGKNLKVLNFVLDLLDGEKLYSGYHYWSSSQSYRDDDAISVYLYENGCSDYNDYKYRKNRVCCIRSFVGEGDNGGSLEATIY